ncbi:glycoside hydrolase superfamily [Lipomyces tetrasporus]
MCPPTTGLGRTFNETYYDEFIDALNFITNVGGYVIIDPHNYMRYNGDNVIGDPNNPNSATAQQFADFWAEMASRVINNAKVIFGIMNEPHDMSTELLLSVDQAAVNGIRMAGTPTSEVLGNITDPTNNFAFDMHQYFDSDGSGTSDQCVSETIGTERLADATTWLQQNNFKTFLSEFGAGSNDVCFDCVDNVLDYLNENDVWIGWSYWEAGPQWGDYFQSIEPYQGPEFTTTWLCLKPHLP